MGEKKTSAEMIKGTFRFADGPVVCDREGTYQYADDFFRGDAREADERLRAMSFAFCMACFPSTEASNYERVYRNAEALLGEIGFTDLVVNDDFRRPPAGETLGILAAHKVIGQGDDAFSVVAVGLRGADYGDEWADNILLEESGEAEGFARGADNLAAFLRDYLARIADALCARVKIWLSGFSRVAAIVNLLGAKIDREADSYGTRTEDLFVYTFECPAAAPAEDDRAYPSIHNFINPHDLVPYLAPRKWGFKRYGVDDGAVPRISSEEFRRRFGEVKKVLRKLNPELVYDILDFRPVCLDGTEFREVRRLGARTGRRRPEGWWYSARQDDYLERFLPFISEAGLPPDGGKQRTDADRRRFFTREMQASAAYAADLFFAATEAERNRIRKNIRDILEIDLQGLRKAQFYLRLRSGTGKSLQKNVEKLGKWMRRRVLQTAPERAAELDGIFAEVAALVTFFIRSASVDARRHHFAFLPTMIHNVDRITVAHMPEVIYAWLQTGCP